MTSLVNKENADTSDLIGVGLYTALEAARLLRIHPTRLRRWLKGYSYQQRGKTRFSPPLLKTGIQVAEEESILTFQDLIECHFINLFLDQGVSLPTIRAAAARAARLFGTSHPFALKRLQTDGKRIFGEMDPADVEETPRERVLQDLSLGQTILADIAQPFFHKLDYDVEEVQRWWPLGKEKRIVLDPRRAFGKPIDVRSGVPSHSLYRMVHGGESVAEVASWYGVEEKAVLDAIEFETDWLRKAA